MSRRTKIVGTIGPASWDEATLRQLIAEGLDVVRLNFSHAEHQKAAEIISLVRKLARETGRNVAVLQDLQGPRIRTGKVSQPLLLIPGQELTLTTRPDFVATTPNLIGIDYPGLPGDVNAGDTILIEDGLFKLQVTGKTAVEIRCAVIQGGTLNSHKGINVPGITLGVPTITAKDIEDLRFGLEHGVDYVALSFVRQAEDIHRLKNLMQEISGKSDPLELPLVIAKIEKHEAVTNFESILEAAGGVMVARGDLGVEMQAEMIPVLQKKFIRRCNEAGKTVITATQMLDSMIRNPRPTRAEATDIANAILDGSDAVMLSGETANGQYPLEAVKMMAGIARTTEKELLFSSDNACGAGIPLNIANSVTDAICQAVCDISRELGERPILATTTSGFTARMIARCRPQAPIWVTTPLERTYRQMALVWGVEAFYGGNYHTAPEAIGILEKILLEHKLVVKGDCLIVTGGVPTGIPGRTNMLNIHTIGEDF